MPCNVLRAPSTLSSYYSISLFILLTASCASSSLPLSHFLVLSASTPFTPLVLLAWRCSIEIQFPPGHPSHLLPLGSSVPAALAFPFFFFVFFFFRFLFSIRETLRTREWKRPAAFLAINYAAQLFTGISLRLCLRRGCSFLASSFR